MKYLKHFIYLLLIGLLFISPNSMLAQKKQAKARVFKAKYYDKSFPLKSVSPILPDGNHRKWKDSIVRNNFKRREYYHTKNTLPKNGDPIVQKAPAKHQNAEPIQNFDGVRYTDNSSGLTPPDTDGDVGPEHYFQMVNVMFEIFDKKGNSVFGPYDNKMLWEGFVGPWTGTNDGDPIVLYDENADRWMATQFSISGTNYYVLIAISETNDPLGSWYRYAFEFDEFPDYPKFGIWNNGYYMSLNSKGDDAVVFDRDALLAGDENAQMITFKTPHFPYFQGFKSALPACSQGKFPPEGTPNYFMYFNDDGWGTGEDAILIWEFDVDWETPSNSTMTLTQTLPVESFDSEFDKQRNDIEQPGTSQKIDAIPGAMMFSLNYRNFETHQAIVANHTVDVDATNHAGVRWYELRNYNDGKGWQIYQQSTFAPDEHSRFMGSMAMDRSGNIALGYSVSSSTVYPSIRYTGRLANDPLNQMTFAETKMVIGEHSQTSINRYGDYSMMSIDPVDDATFWYTNEFIEEGGKWATQIASFQLQDPLTNFDSFQLEKQRGTALFDADQNKIFVKLVYKTNPTALYANFTVAEGSVVKVGEIEQVSGETINDFSQPVVYTITHKDSISQNWTVIVSEEIPESNFLNYSFNNETRAAIIDTSKQTIDVEMPYGTDITNLIANFELSPGAIAYINGVEQVSNTTENDFSTPVTYNVIAMDSTQKNWEVTVGFSTGLCDAGATECDEYISKVQLGTINNESACEGYTDFSYLSTSVVREESYELNITNGNPYYPADELGVWIDWNNNRDFTDDEPITISGTPGTGPYKAIITPPANAELGEVYMRMRLVYGETPTPCGISDYGEVEDYKLYVLEQDENDRAELNSFSFEAANNEWLEENVNAVISGSEVIINVPTGTDITNLTPSFIGSVGATVKINNELQISGFSAHNFSDTVIYQVTSANLQNTNNYKVIVTVGVSVHDNNMGKIVIYPNPANKTVYIQGVSESEITIYNVLGKNVARFQKGKGDREINIAQLPNGTYFIYIINEKRRIVQKFNIIH